MHLKLHGRFMCVPVYHDAPCSYSQLACSYARLLVSGCLQKGVVPKIRVPFWYPNNIYGAVIICKQKGPIILRATHMFRGPRGKHLVLKVSRVSSVEQMINSRATIQETLRPSSAAARPRSRRLAASHALGYFELYGTCVWARAP